MNDISGYQKKGDSIARGNIFIEEEIMILDCFLPPFSVNEANLFMQINIT